MVYTWMDATGADCTTEDGILRQELTYRLNTGNCGTKRSLAFELSRITESKRLFSQVVE